VFSYGLEVIEALVKVWAVLNGPTGKRLRPVMGDLVRALRRHSELDPSDEIAAQLTGNWMRQTTQPTRAS
jgi:hypothetical protein